MSLVIHLPKRDASAPPRNVDRRRQRRMIYSLGFAGSASAPKHELHKAPLARVAMLVKVEASIELFLTEVSALSANKSDPETRKDSGRPTFHMFASTNAVAFSAEIADPSR